VVALPAVGAAAMLAVMLFGWAQTRRSAQLLLRGEGDQLLERAHRAWRDHQDGPLTDAALAKALAQQGDSGVRFVALVGFDGRVVAKSGSPPPGFAQAQHQVPGEVARDGVLAWVRSRPLPGGPGRPPPGGPGDDGPGPPPPHGRPDGDGPGPPPPPLGASLVLCFEPLLAVQVERAATATVVAGVLGAAGLLALSVFARRLLRGRDEALHELERERRMASLGTMSGVVAHELRNPLASLKGHAQLLLETVAPAQKPQAQRVVDEAWRLERLSASLLELARTGSITREATALGPWLRGTLAGFEASRLVVDEARAPASWSLDPVRMGQVVTNLVDNALQAAEGKPVQVMISAQGALLLVEVRDQGPGVPLAERERIFEPFVTTRTKGVGLGLAIARQIVALHGGSLAVRDAEGGGACFRVELPA
jgi:two-component system sensor histidine kinase HydH